MDRWDVILDAYNAYLGRFVGSVIESGEAIREEERAERAARLARLRRQTEEDLARAELLALTREELAEFRAWLRERGEDWEGGKGRGLQDGDGWRRCDDGAGVDRRG